MKLPDFDTAFLLLFSILAGRDKDATKNLVDQSGLIEKPAVFTISKRLTVTKSVLTYLTAVKKICGIVRFIKTYTSPHIDI